MSEHFVIRRKREHPDIVTNHDALNGSVEELHIKCID